MLRRIESISTALSSPLATIAGELKHKTKIFWDSVKTVEEGNGNMGRIMSVGREERIRLLTQRSAAAAQNLPKARADTPLLLYFY